MASVPIDMLSSDLSSTTTPLLVGFLMNCVLYDILVNQIYWYYISFPEDSYRPKMFVFVLAALETAQTAMICHDALKNYAIHFGSITEFDKLQLAWLDIPIMTSIISFLVQSFFAWRIYNLSKNWIVVSAVELVALLQCGAAFAGGIIIRSGETYSAVPLKRSAMLSIEIWLAASAACDTLIALIMVLLLMRTPAHFQKTKALVSKLIKLTIETGMITAVFAVIVLVLFATVGGSYYACLGLLVAKLYSNVALAVLNSRIRVLGGRDGTPRLSTTVDLYVDCAQGLSCIDTTPGTSGFGFAQTEDTHDENDKQRTLDHWDENGLPLQSVSS